MWARRNLWRLVPANAPAASAADDERSQVPAQLQEETFSVSVAVRFRPAVATAGGKDAATAEGDAVVMPLHQRVAMVRAKHGCSQAKAMRIVMRQEAAAKKVAGGEVAEGGGEDECIVVAPASRPSQSALDALDAKQAKAAEALLAAADPEQEAARARRKPHLEGRRLRPAAAASDGPPPSDTAADATVEAPSNRIEAALFDQQPPSESTEEQATDAAAPPTPLDPPGSFQGTPLVPRGIVMVRPIAPGTSKADVVDFFALPVGGAAPLPMPKGEAGVRLVPGRGGSPSAREAAGVAFVEFVNSDLADRAVLRDSHLLRGKSVEVFRTTEDHLAAVMDEEAERAVAARRARDQERAAAKKAAAEAAAAQKEAKRLETIAAARAEAAAVKERRRMDAEAIQKAKEKAAASAAEGHAAGGGAPYGLRSDDKENAGGDEGAESEAALAKAGTAAHDTKAAIISVSAERAEVLAMAPGCGLRPFSFERVFDKGAKQEHVYETCGRAAVADVLNGRSACVLVYGQTGSGKTHTMFGDGSADPRLGSSRYGIVPRVCEELIEAIEQRRALGIDSSLRVAYVEVYGSEVTDLLREGSAIGASDEGADNHFHAHRWVLEGRADVPVDSVAGALALITQGDRCKRKAATAMNERSSRAHALVILSLTQTATETGVERTNRLFLADLGGSEKLTKSQAADDFKSLVVTSGGEEISRITWAEYYQHRARLQESLNINVGLYALQRCIESLIQREALKGEGKPVHVPFADSKLTLILKDALSGGARTTVLVCASLEPRNAVESIQSLRFGEACSRIEMRSKAAGDGAATLKRLVQEIDDEIAATQAIIVRDQRWEKRVTTRYDEVDIKDNLEMQVTKDIADAEVDLGDVAAGVTVVQIDADALDKGGVSRFSRDELKANLERRGLETGGDKQALFTRLREALRRAETEAGGSSQRKQVIAHEVFANVLVGAEEAEAKLEALLARKRELLGEA